MGLRNGLRQRFIAASIAATRNLRSHKKTILWSALTLAVFLTPMVVVALQSGEQSRFITDQATSKNAVEVDLKADQTLSQTSVDIQEPLRDATVHIENTGNAEVKINGQPVAVPPSGSVTETIPDADNESNVRIEIHSDNSSTSNEQDGSSRIRIRSDIDTDFSIRSDGSP